MRDDRIIRPLLDVSKEEILDFLNHEGLAYRVDSSNLDPIYLRNRIRRDLIPDLKTRYNPRIVSSLCRMAEIVRREDDYLQNVVRQILREWGIIPGAEECSPSHKLIPGASRSHPGTNHQMSARSRRTVGKGDRLSSHRGRFDPVATVIP